MEEIEPVWPRYQEPNVSVTRHSTNQPSTLQQEVHVVQLPLDQIYCAPPSRNASSTSNQSNTSRDKKISTTYLLLWLFFLFVIAAVFLVIVLSILYLALKPKSPKFFIESFHIVKSPNYSHTQVSKFKYDIGMKAENPNSHIGLLYQKDGHASLSFKQQEVGVGEPPSFYHGKNHSVCFQVVLDSSEEEVAEEMKTDLESGKVEGEEVLTLSMHVPVKLKIWLVKAWTIKMDIRCNIRVGGEGKSGGFVSDWCHHQVHV
ncbi:hypothetical protein Acr_06g0013340 [Actinidia rufa]|uniref:Late embryogenesis abundant protein LEA-2 subgroup domain-containing protein n=1 Tax=Actinidia rufa TaxID=165716 RepID=A0A7J0ESD1_9ERIC|nr:hypothetical protein Acr_06g0013340 [Actinidia rufa]